MGLALNNLQWLKEHKTKSNFALRTFREMIYKKSIIIVIIIPCKIITLI